MVLASDPFSPFGFKTTQRFEISLINGKEYALNQVVEGTDPRRLSWPAGSCHRGHASESASMSKPRTGFLATCPCCGEKLKVDTRLRRLEPLDPSKKKGAVPTEYPVGYFTSATGITEAAASGRL